MRLTQLDPRDFRFLEDGDRCYHLGDYTARAGFRASETNQHISNLKKRPTVPPLELRWKRKAIEYWGNEIAETNLNWDFCTDNVTFVPFPCSKPVGHELYDDRMVLVLQVAARRHSGMDIRPLLLQTTARDPQHHRSERASPEDIAAQLQIDRGQIRVPLKQTVMVVDDVITRGASFAAAKQLLSGLPGVQSIIGIFLAKTIHSQPDPAEVFGS